MPPTSSTAIAVKFEFAKQSDFVFSANMPPVGTQAVMRLTVTESPNIMGRAGLFVLSIPEANGGGGMRVTGPADLGQPFLHSFKVGVGADGRTIVSATGLCTGGGQPDNNFDRAVPFTPATA